MRNATLYLLAGGAMLLGDTAWSTDIRLQPLAPVRQAVTPRDLSVADKPEAVRITGKRPPLMAARPGWLGEVSGETLFMSRFKITFEKLDKDHDGLLKWAVIDAQGKLRADQAGPEPLPAAWDACYLIDYVHHPAKTEKDPAHPGQYVQTPESYEITGWRTWREALGAVDASGYALRSETGVCNKTEMVSYCKKGAFEMPRTCNSWTGCNCQNGINGFVVIQKEVCVDKQTVPMAFTQDHWMKVAKDHYQREDWNHDGKLDAVEAKEYVCAAE